MTDVGQDRSFAAFVAARGPALLRLAWLLTADAEASRDVVQEALARVLPKWDSLVARGERSRTVRAAVRAVVIDAWRKPAARPSGSAGLWRRTAAWCRRCSPADGRTGAAAAGEAGDVARCPHAVWSPRLTEQTTRPTTAAATVATTIQTPHGRRTRPDDLLTANPPDRRSITMSDATWVRRGWHPRVDRRPV